MTIIRRSSVRVYGPHLHTYTIFSGFAQIRCIIHIHGSYGHVIILDLQATAAAAATAAIVKILEKSILVVTRYSCCAVKIL